MLADVVRDLGVVGPGGLAADEVVYERRRANYSVLGPGSARARGDRVCRHVPPPVRHGQARAPFRTLIEQGGIGCYRRGADERSVLCGLGPRAERIGRAGIEDVTQTRGQVGVVELYAQVPEVPGQEGQILLVGELVAFDRATRGVLELQDTVEARPPVGPPFVSHACWLTS
jgi:hypothetical protein